MTALSEGLYTAVQKLGPISPNTFMSGPNDAYNNRTSLSRGLYLIEEKLGPISGILQILVSHSFMSGL